MMISLKRRLVFVTDMHEVSTKYIDIRIIEYEICLVMFNVRILVMTAKTMFSLCLKSVRIVPAVAGT
jgi:hypothetical protein